MQEEGGKSPNWQTLSATLSANASKAKAATSRAKADRQDRSWMRSKPPAGSARSFDFDQNKMLHRQAVILESRQPGPFDRQAAVQRTSACRSKPRSAWPIIGPNGIGKNYPACVRW